MKVDYLENILIPTLEKGDIVIMYMRSHHVKKVAEILEKSEMKLLYLPPYSPDYSARKTYMIERELPAGKGYADLVFRPRKNNSNPALIVKLKYDKSAEGAIEQIKKKQYADCLNDYSGEILLVGINYNKDDKQHTCKIEKITK